MNTNTVCPACKHPHSGDCLECAWRLVDRYRAALQKIAEPMKYHHWEEDAYTRAACFQFVADEALNEPRK